MKRNDAGTTRSSDPTDHRLRNATIPGIFSALSCRLPLHAPRRCHPSLAFSCRWRQFTPVIHFGVELHIVVASWFEWWNWIAKIPSRSRKPYRKTHRTMAGRFSLSECSRHGSVYHAPPATAFSFLFTPTKGMLPAWNLVDCRCLWCDAKSIQSGTVPTMFKEKSN